MSDAQNSSKFIHLHLLPPDQGVEEPPDGGGRGGEGEAGAGVLALGQEGCQEGGEEGEEGGRYTHLLLLLAQQDAGGGLLEEEVQVMLQGERHHPVGGVVED